jgi:ABC-type taurine transport system substrate-binding protein
MASPYRHGAIRSPDRRFAHGVRSGFRHRDIARRRSEGRQSRAALEIAGLAKDLPYRIEWSEFLAAAPILEALNAGALDFGYTGDLAFLTVYAAGAPIKAVGGTRSDARTQAILVRQDSARPSPT